MTITNDNVQPFETIDERDLHAYIDGLLDAHRTRKVEDYLNRHPEKAAEIQDYMEYNRLLRKAFDRDDNAHVPQRLLSVLHRPVRNIWPAVGKAAAIIALCVLSAGGGWMGAYSTNAAISKEDGIVRNFLHQVALNTAPPFDTMPVETLEVSTKTQTDPLNWLTQKVALEMQAPNLAQAGYTLEGRRLVTRGQQEFVELAYTNSSGDDIKLYMKTRWEKDAPTVGFAQKEGRSIAYWQEGPLVYALTGSQALDQQRAAQIADLVRAAMTDVPDKPPQVQNVQIMQPQSVSPLQPVQQPVQQPQTQYGTPSVIVPQVTPQGTAQGTSQMTPQKMNAVGEQY